MINLFDEQEPGETAKRQYLVEKLEEFKLIVLAGEDVPNWLARVLLELIVKDLKIPHRPLSDGERQSRDLIVWRWAEWRKEQIAKGEKRQFVTPKAVASARADLEELAQTLGKKVLLSETTLKDRITRELESPRPRFWWQKNEKRRSRV